MKKKNAFTLMELLAVLVLLAIIAVISTPIVLGIIEDAKKDTFYKSVLMLVNTTNMDITGKPYEEEYIYTVENGEIINLDIPVSNIEEMTGSIIYNEEGKGEYAIHNDKYCVKKATYMKKAEVSNYNGICDLSTSENCFAFSNGTITDYYDYIDNNNKNDKCPRKVKIPQKIHGKEVTKIGNNAFQEKNITSVEFPSSITSIGEYAFAYNKFSGELDISYLTNLTVLNSYVFAGTEDGTTNQITNIKLPSGITKIGDRAFLYNKLSGELDLSDLTNLTNIGVLSFAGSSDGNTNQITDIILPVNIMSIGDSAFQYNKLRGELDLSTYVNLKTISDSVFRGTSDGTTNQITSVKFPDSITYIWSWAFMNNKLQGELDLSHLTGLVRINNGAFMGQKDGSTNQLTSVKFPNSINIIGPSAFQYNRLSGDLDLSNTVVTKIFDTAFGGTSDGNTNQLSSLKLPNTITALYRNSFEYNKLNGELDLSNCINLTAIENYTFRGSSDGTTNQITSIKFPSGITSIGQDAFVHNKLSGELNLSHLTGLTTIGQSAFEGNRNKNTNQISSLKLPSSVASMGTGAFANNAISEKLDISHLTNLTTISHRLFFGNQISSIILPNSLVTISSDSFYSNQLTGELDLSNLTNLTTLWKAFEYNKITSIKLPPSLTKISDWCFAQNNLQGELDLRYLTNLTSIGQGAFNINQISSVKIPSSVIEIKAGAFSNNQLTSVTFYGRSDLTGVSVGTNAWSWAPGYNNSNIYFVNE